MRAYVQRLAELAGAAFIAGSGQYVVTHGFDLSKAALQGAVVAGLAAAYGLVAKNLGDKDRPTVSK